MSSNTDAAPVFRTPGRLPLLLIAVPLVLGACADDEPPVDGVGSSTNVTTVGSAETDNIGPNILCEPDEQRCSGQAFIETCAPTGLEWTSEPCGLNEWCEPCADDDTCTADRCMGPCDIESDLPSSAGCSFVTTRGLHISPNNPDGLVVANPNPDLTAVVQLYYTESNQLKEEPLGDPIVLEPLGDALFELDSDFIAGGSSLFRTGGVHRIESNAPIVAYLHAPLVIDTGMDSSLLLPETTAGRHYVALTYFPNPLGNQGEGQPSWFEIVALEDFTTVTWTPTVNTAGHGLNIKFVEAGTKSEPLPMTRFDTARIAASKDGLDDAKLRDLAGTVIESNRPVLVWSGVRCSRVPQRDDALIGHCDPLQELLIPIDYWGERYVAAASPRRGDERHYWRIYSGYDDVTITTEPQVLDETSCTETGTKDGTWDGTGCTLRARGSFFEISVAQGVNFFIQSNGVGTNAPKAFMPVQYLQGASVPGEPAAESTLLGDPSMVQSIPVEQYLSRYVFSTGVNYPINYVQIIRQQSSADVYLGDGQVAITIPDDEFTAIGDTYEVANHFIDEGTYVAESGEPFGIIQMGWTNNMEFDECEPENPIADNICRSSYAYPGGMKAERINIE